MKIAITLKDGSEWEEIEVARDDDGLRAMDSQGEEIDLFGRDRLNKVPLVDMISDGLDVEGKL